MTFNVILKDLMNERNITLKELAKITNMNLGSLYFYFKNNTFPDIICAAKLSDYFQCSIDYLIGFNSLNNYKPTNYKLNFIKNYDFLLKKFKTNNYKVCNNLGISYKSIYFWRKGAIPKIPNLMLIATYFNVSIDYLVDRSDEI